MAYTLLIKTANEDVTKMYENHGTYNEGDSGLDLFVTDDTEIDSRSTELIGSGIRCEMIDNETGANASYYLYTRSSIYKTPLMLANHVGIIDAGYRGEIKSAFRNLSDKSYKITAGTRLVQICAPDLKPFTFKIVEKLSDTKRGAGGFGSTTKK
jgi:dUTP pyrophosphatase